MKRMNIFLIALVMVFCFSAQAYATLFLRGQGSSDYGTYNMIYDDDLDITWYDYAHGPETLEWDKWMSMVNWADGLLVNFGGANYDDWRLPVSDNCLFFNCSDSEMGHLYYEEGISSDSPGPFNNIQADIFYSGTPYPTEPVYIWSFDFRNGRQAGRGIDVGYYALAVRDGDVAPVPEPSTFLLLGSGFAGLCLIRRRKYFQVTRREQVL